jgi:hypothetical protein
MGILLVLEVENCECLSENRLQNKLTEVKNGF